MAFKEILMPSMGESVMEATVLGWLKEIGDKIDQDESLLEVATDKVDTEVPSPIGGILKKKLAKEGDVVQVGKPLAIIEVGNGQEVFRHTEEVAINKDVDTLNTVPRPQVAKENTSEFHHAEKTRLRRYYSPLVKNIAHKEHISSVELEQIPGSGKDNRVTKNDILAFLERKKTVKINPDDTSHIAYFSNNIPVRIDPGDEIIEMDRMRRMIAERMISSVRISPHVTSFVETDLTNAISWREKIKNEFLKREGEKFTLTPIFIEAIVKAIKDYPMVNVSIDGYKIIKKKSINIGVAVALPDGNLIVPVIHNADQLSLMGLAKKVNDYAVRARQNKLKPEELSGGTYTITNIGTFGNIAGTPIILQPQVAIMAFGIAKKKPTVIETPYGDTIGIRHKMIMAHSYDHRVVDGALGGLFAKKVGEYLESFDIKRKL
jgi:2-oxoglutarate dehydrogenase E2 component (dihydrolipoamide succinyltransferase)